MCQPAHNSGKHEAPENDGRHIAVSQLLWPDKDREVCFSFGGKPRKGLSLRSTPIAKLR
jgi:hypothetical protein